MTLIWPLLLSVPAFRACLAHHLNGVHDVGLLVVVGVAEFGGPGEIRGHILQHGRKWQERLDAGVPGLLIGFGGQFLRLQVAARREPTIGVGDFGRVARSRQDAGDQRIRIESDGRDKLLQLLRRLGGIRLAGGRGCRGGAPCCGDGADGCPEYGFCCASAGARLFPRRKNRPKAASASQVIGLRFEETMIALQSAERPKIL